MVSGVLLDVSRKLGVSLAAAGRLSTAFAIVHAIGAALLGTPHRPAGPPYHAACCSRGELLKLPAVEGVALVD